MYFIKLIRPSSLVIIGITMYGLGWYLEDISVYTKESKITSLEFTLLVVSTIMIAAAGNIINDYFDIKVDRVNRPKDLIIDKFIKRRVAIFTHWIINFFAFLIAIYLSWKLNTFWYVFIHLFSISLLWYYSIYFKRKFLIGNLIIALLTSMVPIIVGFYFHNTEDILIYNNHQNLAPFPIKTSLNFTLLLSFCLAGFAFILNLAREIVKDIQNIEGDKKLKAKTLPITLGQTKSKIIFGIVLSTTILGSFIILSFLKKIDIKVLLPIALSALFIVICFLLIPKAKTKKQFKIISYLIKLSIISGLISPIYWKLLIIYA